LLGHPRHHRPGLAAGRQAADPGSGGEAEEDLHREGGHLPAQPGRRTAGTGPLRGRTLWRGRLVPALWLGLPQLHEGQVSVGAGIGGAGRRRRAHIVWVGLSASRVPASRVSILPFTASASAVSANCTPMPAVRLPWEPAGVIQTTLPA